MSQDIITKFTAKASRGGVSAGSSCGLGNGSVYAPTVDYTCSGGNVRIGDGPPRTPVDAGSSIDSGSSKTDSSVDSAVTVDASEDAGAVYDNDSSSVDAALTIESGIEDAGVADSGTSSASLSQERFMGMRELMVVSRGVGTHSYSFNSNVRAGSLLVMAYSTTQNVGPAVVTVKDTVGTTYLSAFTVAAGSYSAGVVYGLAPVSGADTLTITQSNASATNRPYFIAYIVEVRGVRELDALSTWDTGSNRVTRASIQTFSSGSVTPSRPHELLLGVGVVNAREFILGTSAPLRGAFLESSYPTFVGSDLFYSSAVMPYAAVFTTRESTPGYGDTPSYAAAAGIVAFR